VTSDNSFPFISCGMYAFTDDLQFAWQSLFTLFADLTEPGYRLDPTLLFDTDESTLWDSRLFIGHTCGYPFMKNLQDALSPVCIPIFDVAGCEGKLYSSAFITSLDNDIESLTDCYQRVAAINGRESNSGMNVLRHAIAPLSQDQDINKSNNKAFFSDVIESGSHRQSLIEVGAGRADIAAIDCVSLALMTDAWPELAARIRVIGYSAKTCGLPFVMPNARFDSIYPGTITLYLNQALVKLPQALRQRLHLQSFVDTQLGDYQRILDLEAQAHDAGYPNLV
jgi:ABC-type phosphate/phosphonate transport system substrate-binding protein